MAVFRRSTEKFLFPDGSPSRGREDQRLQLLRCRPEAEVLHFSNQKCLKLSHHGLQWRPRPDSRSHVQYIYLLNALCPTEPPSQADQTAIPAYDIPELLGKRETHSLRQLAHEYGVSHETVRKALAVSRPHH